MTRIWQVTVKLGVAYSEYFEKTEEWVEKIEDATSDYVIGVASQLYNIYKRQIDEKNDKITLWVY